MTTQESSAVQQDRQASLQDLDIRRDKENSVTDAWLAQNGVRVEAAATDHPEKNLNNPEWLQQVGILPAGEAFVSAELVTQQYLPPEKHKPETSWSRGGYESYYQIHRIISKTSSGETKSRLVATKAIITGQAGANARREATFLTHLHNLGLAPKVYVLGNGLFLKEFVEGDAMPLSQEDHDQQIEGIIAVFATMDIRPLTPGRVDTVPVDGQLQVVDMGSGDIVGPSAYEFVQNLSPSAAQS